MSGFFKHSDVDTLLREKGGERFQTIHLVDNTQHHLKLITVYDLMKFVILDHKDHTSISLCTREVRVYPHI